MQLFSMFISHIHRFIKRKAIVGLISITMICIFSSTLAHATYTMISEVPAYNWYHGCGPTAAASVLGYWDLHGYDNLFTASGSDVYLTTNVQEQISSSAHNAKYDPYPDNSSLPIPPMTSIADWFQTSVGSLKYGYSYVDKAPIALTGYAEYRGYTFQSYYEPLGAGQFTWNDLTSEIDAGRPMMFAVDSSGDGRTDHFVPVLGYDDRGLDGLWYGFFSTWSEAETINWMQFREESSSYEWGVGYGVFIEPTSTPTPIPAAVWLFGSGLLGLFGVRRKIKR